MAYLTEYSFRQLVKTTEIKDLDRINLQFFISNIYENSYLFYFFNQFELKTLFKEKLILSSDKNYILTYREVPVRNDDLNYVIKIKGKVKYHFDKGCEALNRGFKNFFIPEAVVRLKNHDIEKHRLIVDDIRNWFITNNLTIERYEGGEINSLTITKMYNSYFPDKYNIEPISISQSDNEQNNFQWYIAKKTNNVEIEKTTFDYDIFLKNIIELIKKREYLCNSRTMQNLSRYDYLLGQNDDDIIKIINTNIEKGILNEVSPNFIDNYGLSSLKEFWGKHKKLKQEAYSELSEYFKWTYNLKEKQFDNLYLESFNLEACSLCGNKKQDNTL
ncbi:hypothetical protein ABGT15_09015 [Flavobacterium enshiense]|uniref:hypothetical protein n=1 Tax=Flavobacterium enshiense TaxID=1341165 RepID=UPI00345D0A14